MEISIVSKVVKLFQSGSDLVVVIRIFLLITIFSLIGYIFGQLTSQSELNSRVIVNKSNPETGAKILKIAEINNAKSSINDNTGQVEVKYPIVFGSINGTKYYNYGCKSGDRIKSENRVYFATYAEAELHEYEPALNCKFEYGNN